MALTISGKYRIPELGKAYFMTPSYWYRSYFYTLSMDIRYKVLWIGEIGKHKSIGETKVLQGKEEAKVLWIYWLP